MNRLGAEMGPWEMLPSKHGHPFLLNLIPGVFGLRSAREGLYGRQGRQGLETGYETARGICGTALRASSRTGIAADRASERKGWPLVDVPPLGDDRGGRREGGKEGKV